jgi:hypothetical protein
MPDRLFELARVLVRFDHVASFIVNANRGVMAAVRFFRTIVTVLAGAITCPAVGD